VIEGKDNEQLPSLFPVTVQVRDSVATLSGDPA